MASCPIQRTGSGHDPKKAKGQRDALGGQSASITASSSSSPPERTTYTLVVCGATDPVEDGWIFSDFMGYCMALKKHGFAGDFYSCFPIQDHLVWLKNVHNIDTVKFGKYGPNNKCLFSYSPFQYCNQQYFWNQIGQDVLVDEVVRWISTKSQVAEAGDIINIILESHGSKKFVKIGSKGLFNEVFRELAALFKPGVEVNIISGACYSGLFGDIMKTSGQTHRYVAAAGNKLAFSCTRSVSNRLRNSRFSQAFVQSLAKINLPGTPRRQLTWCLRDHEEFMRQKHRDITPGVKPVDPPQFFATEPIDEMTALEQLIFTSKIDVLYDERTSARRRRIEWPTEDDVIWNVLRSEPGSYTLNPIPLPATAEALVKGELDVCDTRSGFIHDIPVFNQVYVKTPDYRKILKNLYWRARRQSAIWDVFNILVQTGLLDEQCLRVPFDSKDISDEADTVTCVLGCFSRLVEDSDLAGQGKIPLQTATPWMTDAGWLATMMVRSQTPFGDLFEKILSCGFLGDLDTVAYGRTVECGVDLNFERNPRNGEPNPDDMLLPDGTFNPDCNQFGIWLPHGLSSDPVRFQLERRECEQRFNRIEAAFREAEGLSPDHLWLESEQVGFFERYPEKLPGMANDIPDEVVEITPPDSESPLGEDAEMSFGEG